MLKVKFAASVIMLLIIPWFALGNGIIEASRYGSPSHVRQALVSEESRINTFDNKGMTPLMYASAYNDNVDILTEIPNCL